MKIQILRYQMLYEGEIYQPGDIVEVKDKIGKQLLAKTPDWYIQVANDSIAVNENVEDDDVPEEVEDAGNLLPNPNAKDLVK